MRIQTAEHLTEYGDVSYLWILSLDVTEEFQHSVPVSLEQLRVVIELLSILQHRCTLGEPHGLTVAEEAGVGTMYLLLYHIFQILWHFCHYVLHELTAKGVFDRAVLLEF